MNLGIQTEKKRTPDRGGGEPESETTETKKADENQLTRWKPVS